MIFLVDNETTGHIFHFMNAKKDNKRTAILESGAEVMLRKGYHGTGVQEIVDSAGVPKGSFYNYFKSKEDFLLSAMEYTSYESITRFEAALQDDTLPPKQRIIETYNRQVADIEAAGDFSRGCFTGNICQELADTNTAIAEKAEYIFRRYTTVLARCIRKAQAEQEIDRRIDPDKMAEAVFNSWEGAVLRMKSSRNSQPLNAFREMLNTLLT